MTRYITGFPVYGRDDDDLVFEADLKSAASITDIGGTQAGITFDSVKGMSFSARSAAIRMEFSGVALSGKQPQTALANGGCIAFKVTRKFLDTAIAQAGSAYLLFGDGGGASTSYIYKVNNAGGAQFLYEGANVTHGRLRYQPAGRSNDDYAQVHVMTIGTYTVLFVDEVPCVVWKQEITGEFTSFSTFLAVSDYWGSNVPDDDIWFKDLQVIARPLAFTTPPEVGVINWYGDSFIGNGSYPIDWNTIGDKDATTDNGAPDAGTGTDPGSVADNSAQTLTGANNAGMMVVCDAILKANGYGSAFGQHFPWGCDGWGVETTDKIETRIADSLSNLYPAPNIAVINVSTNDVASSPVLDSTWKSTLQTNTIDPLIADGCDKIILINCAPRDNDPTDTNADRTDAANVLLKEVGDDNVEIYMLDAFTLLGGHSNYDPADFLANDIHLSAQGNRKYGGWIAGLVMGMLV